MVSSVKNQVVTNKQPEQAALQVDLASFVALPVAQKQLYLSALEGDPRFAEILPRLQAVLAKESGAAQQTGPVGASQEAPAKAAPGMGAATVAHLLSQLQSQGYGDTDYWMKMTTDVVRTAQSFAPMVQALAEREKGSLGTTLSGLADELSKTTSAGYGDSSYWSGRAAAACKVAHTVANQLRALDGVSQAEIPAKEALLLLAGVAESTSSKGYGDSDYWSKSAATAAYTAQLAGVGVAEVAKKLDEPDRTVIGNIATRLKNTVSEGYGDSSYWSGRTADVVNSTHSIARTLREAVGAMS